MPASGLPECDFYVVSVSLLAFVMFDGSVWVRRGLEVGSPKAKVRLRCGITGRALYLWQAEVQRDECVGPAEAGGAGRREPAGLTRRAALGSQDGVSGLDAGRFGAEGPAGKKPRSPGAHLEAMLRLVAGHRFSKRRACWLVQVDPKALRHAPSVSDAEVRERLRGLAVERSRFGCRRLGILLAREGVSMNRKKLFRLHREERLAVRRRRGRKRHRHVGGECAAGRGPASLESGPDPWLSSSSNPKLSVRRAESSPPGIRCGRSGCPVRVSVRALRKPSPISQGDAAGSL